MCVLEDDWGVCMQWHVIVIQLPWVYVVLLCMPSTMACVYEGRCIHGYMLGVRNIKMV